MQKADAKIAADQTMSSEGYSNFALSRTIRLGQRHYQFIYHDAFGNPVCLNLVFDDLNFDKWGWRYCT